MSDEKVSIATRKTSPDSLGGVRAAVDDQHENLQIIWDCEGTTYSALIVSERHWDELLFAESLNRVADLIRETVMEGWSGHRMTEAEMFEVNRAA